MRCSECKVYIKHRGNLNRHIKEFHGTPRVYSCKYCPHSTYRKHDIDRHEGRVHSGKPKNQSHGEAAVEEAIVNNLNFEDYCYETEKKFNNLRSYEKNGQLKYDFAISPVEGKKKYYIIEYDGKQHYEPVRWTKKMSYREAVNKLEEVQSHDNQKDHYASVHGYPLMRIPYKQFKNVKDLVVEFLETNGLL